MNGRPLARKPFVLFVISLLLVTTSGCFSTISAQNFFFDGKQKRNAINFEIVKNLIIIPVYLNGTGPYNFILDTGVGATLVTDTTLKRTLNLKHLRSLTINGLGKGKDIKAKISNDVVANIGYAQMKNMPTIFIDEDPFNLSAYLGKKIVGLIGYSFFDSFIVKVDYASKRLIFGYPNAKIRPRGDKIALEIIGNKPYITTFIETPGLGRVETKLIVDCGASHNLSLEKLNDAPFPHPALTIQGNLGVGIGGEITGQIGRISTLALGRYRFKNVLANFPMFSAQMDSIYLKGRNGNLGAEILKRFNVTYDYQNKFIYLKKNVNFSDPFEHDMSGLEIYFLEGAYFIGRIEKGSPAEKVGFLPDDQIIGLNFKSVDNFSMDMITNLLKENDGRAVIVEIFRKETTIVKVLKLKKRI